MVNITMLIHARPFGLSVPRPYLHVLGWSSLTRVFCVCKTGLHPLYVNIELITPDHHVVSRWYVSVVSIIFDCSMPIFYNFHILLATFYTIFGTNILIQCPVPVPVGCMFFVSQKIHIKWSPNGIKTDGYFFWNICAFWEEKSTRDDAWGGHEAGARPRGSGAPWTLVSTP